MNSLRTLTIIGFLAFVADGSAAVLLTNFGSSGFLIDGSTSFSTSQNTSSLQINGSDNGSQLDGFFGPVNITGQTGILTLYGTVTSPPASPFSVTLFDNNSNTALYTGGSWTGLSASDPSTALTFFSKDAGFSFSSISGLELKTGGVLGTISATLTGISASASGVPEPSRALLTMMGLLSFAIRRRRVWAYCRSFH